ncbi:MAG: hypothetical protein ABIF10_04240 [Candidatus Woesearchaeota archaeon]
MRGSFLLAMCILTAASAFADIHSATYSVAIGIIEINITNEAPQIVWMQLEEAYEDTSVACNATATDREGDGIRYSYKWYKNSQEIGYTGKELPSEYFSAGDTVACEATPYDRHKNGTSGIASTYIKEVPFQTAAVKTALLLAGTKPSTSQVAEITQKGLVATTGFVVREVGSSAGKTPIILGISAILVFVNINLILRLKRLKATY